MQNGFLGYPASFMLDVVVCALVLVVPILLFSLYAVKVQRNYQLHKKLQVLLGLVLLIAVGLFEIDMRMQGGVTGILAKRNVPLSVEQNAFFYQLLWVHLFFSVSTVLLWGLVLARALKHFPDPAQPSPHSRFHKTFGWLATVDLTLTSVTGLMVYYFGFVV